MRRYYETNITIHLNNRPVQNAYPPCLPEHPRHNVRVHAAPDVHGTKAAARAAWTTTVVKVTRVTAAWKKDLHLEKRNLQA